jgi:uncharacterized membrane protein (DUF373 family)
MMAEHNICASKAPKQRPAPDGRWKNRRKGRCLSIRNGRNEKRLKKGTLPPWQKPRPNCVEDVAYVGLGLVLSVSALVLLVVVALSLGEAIISANLPVKIVRLLDQSLLILMIVEILYTLQVSFREHTLVAEPFLIVGLIAAIRRVLILTAEFSKPAEIGEAAFHNVMFELGLLTVLILALVFSLFLMRRQPSPWITHEHTRSTSLLD